MVTKWVEDREGQGRMIKLYEREKRDNLGVVEGRTIRCFGELFSQPQRLLTLGQDFN